LQQYQYLVAFELEKFNIGITQSRKNLHARLIWYLNLYFNINSHVALIFQQLTTTLEIEGGFYGARPSAISHMALSLLPRPQLVDASKMHHDSIPIANITPSLVHNHYMIILSLESQYEYRDT